MLEGLHAHVEPAVIAAAAPATIRIVPDDPGASLPPGECQVTVHPVRLGGQVAALTATAGSDGEVAFSYVPTATGECAVTVRFPNTPVQQAGSFYVAEPELARLIPLRGDLHTHTWFSDGRSSPAALLRRAVERGLDILAITDHNNYAGSAEALRLAPELAGALTLLAGEEVTFDRGHIVAIGASEGVAPAYAGAADEFAAIATEEARRLASADLPLEQYARAAWVARRIRARGGLAFVAHPFWVCAGEYHLDWRVTRQLLLDGEVDGVELLGDVLFEDNLLSIAGYMELLSEGVSTTVLGNSDTHGVEHTFGQYWSTVFAADAGSEAVMEALRERRSVACVRLPGEELRLYGPLALVQFGYFLHRRYFPALDAATAACGGDFAAVAAAKSGVRTRLLPR